MIRLLSGLVERTQVGTGCVALHEKLLCAGLRHRSLARVAITQKLHGLLVDYFLAVRHNLYSRKQTLLPIGFRMACIVLGLLAVAASAQVAPPSLAKPQTKISPQTRELRPAKIPIHAIAKPKRSVPIPFVVSTSCDDGPYDGLVFADPATDGVEDCTDLIGVSGSALLIGDGASGDLFGAFYGQANNSMIYLQGQAAVNAGNQPNFQTGVYEEGSGFSTNSNVYMQMSDQIAVNAGIPNFYFLAQNPSVTHAFGASPATFSIQNDDGINNGVGGGMSMNVARDSSTMTLADSASAGLIQIVGGTYPGILGQDPGGTGVFSLGTTTGSGSYYSGEDVGTLFLTDDAAYNSGAGQGVTLSAQMGNTLLSMSSAVKLGEWGGTGSALNGKLQLLNSTGGNPITLDSTNGSGTFSGTLSAPTVAATTITATTLAATGLGVSTSPLCTTTGGMLTHSGCSGGSSGGSGISGGVANTIPMFSGASTLTNSSITDVNGQVTAYEPITIEQFNAGGYVGLTLMNNFGVPETASLSQILFAGYSLPTGYAAIQSGGTDPTNGNGFLGFQTSSQGTLAEHMRLTPGGALGIGTSSPNSTLHVVSPSSALASNGSAWGNGNFVLQGTGPRSTLAGSAMTFATAATTDGGNVWEQARIIATADAADNGDASGRLYLQTRYYDPFVGWQWNNGLVLTSSGNVGIGMTTPSQPLEVAGNIRADGNFIFVGPVGGGIYGDSANTVIQAPVGGNVYLANVGIAGTHVAESDGSVYIGGPSQGGARLYFPDGTSMNTAPTSGGGGSPTLPTDLVYTDLPTQQVISGSTSFSSNVSLGTTVAAGTLTIASPASDGAGTPLQGILFVDTLSPASPWGQAAIYSVGSPGFNGNLVFATDGDGQPNINPTEKMRITSGGNVGIGTTNPGLDVGMAGGLTINGTGSTMLQVENNGTNSFALNPGWGGGGGWTLFDYGSGGWAQGISQYKGNVGIGTTSPGADLGTLSPIPPAILEVNGVIALTHGQGGQMIFQDGTVQSTAWNGTLSGGDYAESIDVLGDRSTYEPGDVIVIDESITGKFDKSGKAYSKLVAGVYSTKPGLVGRRTTTDRPDKADEVPMAMMGIVPTKVSAENGPIERGDLLVSASTPGYAMKGTDRDRLTGAVIGKALAPLSSGTGLIEVLISLQ